MQGGTPMVALRQNIRLMGRAKVMWEFDMMLVSPVVSLSTVLRKEEYTFR